MHIRRLTTGTLLLVTACAAPRTEAPAPGGPESRPGAVSGVSAATADAAPMPETAAPPEYEQAAPAPPPSVAAAPAEMARESRAIAAPARPGVQPAATAKREKAKSVSPAPEADVSTSGESYQAPAENPFRSAVREPLSTFSIDVDTASYANVRRFLTGGSLPPPEAVRIEELVNYFTYDYPTPKGSDPFAVAVEIAACPWSSGHRLARVALKGREVPVESRKPASLVFLLDVSGSMNAPNKLPLLKTGLKMLVNNLSPKDRVAIVVYAGASGLVLPSTPCDRKPAIVEALEQLQAGGSTNAGAGIELAYKVAQDNFIQGGVNRVLLATDGDFNVGVTSQDELVRLIEKKAKQGVFLTVLGLGMGNYKDSTLEMLADKGNGNYAYIDTEGEARKVLVEQIGGTLVTIAKDVKIQVEFNPAKIGAYRLLGYENRLLRAEDFTDDKKDAGEIGAGHNVTAFYELVPTGKEGDLALAEVVATAVKPEHTFASDQLLVVKLRYKEPTGSTSKPLAVPVADRASSWQQASADFRFAAAVVAYGMLLRNSPHKGATDWQTVVGMAEGAKAADPGGYREEFVRLAKAAQALAKK